jgi:formate dehydrogenase alpha subunit
MTNSIDEIESADCILVIGSNTSSQHPMIASKIMRAKDRGSKLIVVDTRKIPLSAYADVFLQIRPGTNIALLHGMINVLMQKGWINEPFIKDRTEGFEELKEKVSAYTPRKASEITGISEIALEMAAELYGRSKRSTILYAMGVTQHTTGTNNVKAVANLAMVTGNIGRPSTGVNPLRGQNNVQGACDMGALPDFLTAYQRVAEGSVRERFANKWGLGVPEKPGQTVVEMLDSAGKGALKGMLIVGENPMISDPDITHVRHALESLDFLLVQDIFLTETAQLADVVLPACSFAEKDGTFTNTDRRVQRVRKAIEPIGESKPDWMIISDLARRMGCEAFGYSSSGEIMKEITSVTPSYGGISYDRLDRGEVLHWPCPDESHPGTPFLHKGSFVRGKGKFFPVDYLPPPEMPDEEYPFLLNTGRLPFHFHGGSITRRIELLDKEVSSGFISLHPDDARKLETREGEQLRVASRRGELTIRVRISDEVEPGSAFIPMHFAECPVNVLTDTKLDPDAKIPDLKVCAVKIERIQPGS